MNHMKKNTEELGSLIKTSKDILSIKKPEQQKLFESLIFLSKNILTMINAGDILGIFCVGSPQYVIYSQSTLPYILRYRQISPELYDKITDAISLAPGNMADSFSVNEQFYINNYVFDFLKKKADKAVKEKQCSSKTLKKFNWIQDMLSEITFSRKYLKFPIDLIFNDAPGTSEIVSMFQPVKTSKKPISITDPETMRVDVIRKPFVDNAEIRSSIRRLLAIGVLGVDDQGFIFLTKLGAEITTLFSIGSAKKDLSAEEWVYIYAPLLVSKVFEAFFMNLQVRRILTILRDKGNEQSIFEIMADYGPEGDISNITWPVWSIPVLLGKYGGKLDTRAKKHLYSSSTTDIQEYLDTCVSFGWIEAKDKEYCHDNGIKSYCCTIPAYSITDAGLGALKISSHLPKTRIYLEQNVNYLVSGYLDYRQAVILHAIMNGCETEREIGNYAKKLGVTENALIIRDVIDDLIRLGFNIQKLKKKDSVLFYSPTDINIMQLNDLSAMKVEKPEHIIKKDEDRLLLTKIGRRHLLLCDLVDRKKIIKHSKKNQIDLFRIWLTDMIKSTGIRCETFGNSSGPDVVVTHKKAVIYVSVEGAFDDNPKLSSEKMIGALKDNSAFRSFLNPKSREATPYYVYIVKNGETFQSKNEILKSIANATGNKNGAVLDFHEIIRILNEYAVHAEHGQLSGIIDHLFTDKERKK